LCEWPGKLAPFLLGEASEEDVLQASAAEVPLRQQRQRCVAHFYIGATRLKNGDEAGYRRELELALVEGFNWQEPEYFLACSELRRAPHVPVLPADPRVSADARQQLALPLQDSAVPRSVNLGSDWGNP
jgi:hypothetical protein